MPGALWPPGFPTFVYGERVLPGFRDPAESGRWLKLVSGVVMLVLGAIMLLRPEWL